MIRQFGVPTTIDDIIETTIVQLAKHELLNGGAGINYNGAPLKVKKYRNFNGVELKESGLTLSVYPFNYEGTSRPTPESTNTSISFKPYGLMGSDPTKPRNAIDTATANIKIRLDFLSYSLRTLPQSSTIIGDPSNVFGTTTSVQSFETNDAESMLRKYVEYVRLILSTDLFNLNGWVKSSFVTWCNFPTTNWDAGSSLIIHTAELMWQVHYYPLREWRVDQGVRGKDPIIGSLQADGAPVFYLEKHDVLVTGYGVVILNTPSGVSVTWDKTTNRLVDPKTREPLSVDALKDKNSDRAFIRLDILPIGILQNGNIPVYFNKTSSSIIKYDGTVINKIPGPGAKLTNKLLDTSDTSSWIPVAWNSSMSKLVYGVGHPNAGSVVKNIDLVDPSNGNLYIITDHYISFGSSNIREFAVFK
jgi:hypothetical protein